MVSVIIPVYKVEKYLRECVDSVLAQTYKDTEIILVDDGSPDNCGAICDEYAAKEDRIEVIHKKNGGLSDARNAGLAAAHGEYVYFLDSDDYITHNALEKLVSRIESENADFVYFDADTIYEDFNDSDYRETLIRKNCYITEAGAKSFLAQLNNTEYYSCVPLLFFRRRFLEKNGLCFLKGIMHEDELFTALAFVRAERATHLNEPLYIRRLRANSIMSERISPKSIEGLTACICHMADEMEKYPQGSDRRRVLAEYIKILLFPIFERYSVLGAQDRADARRHIQMLRTRLAAVNYLGSRKLMIKLNAADLFVFYKKHIKPHVSAQTDGGSLSLAGKARRTADRYKRRANLSRLLGKLPAAGKRVIILATPTHGNLGDQAIVYAEKKLLKNIFGSKKVFEIPNDHYLEFPDMTSQALSDDDIIVIDGGGNLGTIWKNEDDKIADIISRFKNNRIIVFPQTCYYDDIASAEQRIKRNRRIYSAAKRLTVMLRDKDSFELFTKLFPEVKAYLVPDIVLSIKARLNAGKRSGALLCFRADCEKYADSDMIIRLTSELARRGFAMDTASTYIEGSVGVRNRREKLREKFLEFSSAEIVVTDRLHAMIFCAVTGTPCLALDNVSKKVSGGFEWIKELGYIRFVNSADEIKGALSDILGEHDLSQRFVYPTEKVKSIICEAVPNVR